MPKCGLLPPGTKSVVLTGFSYQGTIMLGSLRIVTFWELKVKSRGGTHPPPPPPPGGECGDPPPVDQASTRSRYPPGCDPHLPTKIDSDRPSVRRSRSPPSRCLPSPPGCHPTPVNQAFTPSHVTRSRLSSVPTPLETSGFMGFGLFRLSARWRPPAIVEE